MDEDLNMLMSMEDLQWEAFCQMLAKIGMVSKAKSLLDKLVLVAF